MKPKTQNARPAEPSDNWEFQVAERDADNDDLISRRDMVLAHLKTKPFEVWSTSVEVGKAIQMTPEKVSQTVRRYNKAYFQDIQETKELRYRNVRVFRLHPHLWR